MISYSFIIPHHNGPKLLNKLLATIPQRDDIEILVIDDNSDENKKPEINRNDVTIINIGPEETKGAGHARNKGLFLAKGKWLLFADSDDFYETGFIDELDKYKDTELDIIYFDAHVNYNPEDGTEKIKGSNIFKDLNTYCNSNKTLHDIQRLGLSTNAPWNKMFRKEFVIKNGAEFEEIPISNDAWFVNYCGCRATKIEIITKKLYYYTINPQGITNKKKPLLHYELASQSNSRRNRLKYEYGCPELIAIPGLKKNLLRDFGRITYYRMYLMKIITDPIIRKLLIEKFLKKLS